MKSTKITAPEGYEIDRDKSTFDEIVFKEVDKEFARSWEELGDFDGYYLNGIGAHHNVADDSNKGLYATKAQAQSALAMAQLSQLMEEVNECQH